MTKKQWLERAAKRCAKRIERLPSWLLEHTSDRAKRRRIAAKNKYQIGVDK